MNLYRIDIKICATAYIKANTAKEAHAIAKARKGDEILLPDKHDLWVNEDLVVTGRRFDDPELADVSLSPAMTNHGPWGRAELAE